MFPDWAVDLGLLRRGLAYRFFKLIERQQHLAADVIGVQAPSDRRYLDHLTGTSRRRVEVLWNWLSDPPNVGSSLRVSETALAGRTIFVYAGNMGVAQKMDSFVDLAERLRSRADIGFLFVGRGSEYPRLEASARARGLRNVLFHEEIPSEEIPGLLAQCDVGLLALDPRHQSNNIPGKFLAYLRAGLPVLAHVNAGSDLDALISTRAVGLVSDPEVQESLRMKAEALADNRAEREQMARRGRALAAELFSPTTTVNQIISSLSARP
jgi:glycosyltransferase involved in cell wall biosynthesis